MWLRLVLGYLLAITTLIPESDGETVQTSLKSKADIFRLLLNQETLIRSALEKKVFGLVNDVLVMKEIMINNKKEIVYLKNENQELKAETIRQLRDAKIKMATLKKENQDLQAETSKQLKIAEEESVALRNEIQALKAKFQSQANVTNLLAADVEESKKTHRNLSSAVLSLESFQKNISLLRSLVKGTPVAFTAGMTSYSSTWNGDILVFPHVITNKGEGYSSSSGKFTAPRDGTYVFTVTAVSFGSNHLRLDIVHDDVRKVRTYSSQYASFLTGTNLVVLELDRGDVVWVKRVSGQGYYTEAVPLTTFSGFLL
uniref:Uncharacterized protein LOC111102308 n=1 Tax=Crassostrea virginica TaxID=6565 RepID=A0A8B8AHQ0_CRAVI|nr:uncharacterized protein LOC111102308 [Crassostrea virginica]